MTRYCHQVDPTLVIGASMFSRSGQLTLPVFLIAIAVLPGCGKESSPPVEAAATVETPVAVVVPPPATPGLELQPEVYANVMTKFRTKLLRKGPAPQEWEKAKTPTDVLEVEYRSAGLRLKAWTHRPAG